jgi:hypothetical protein
VRYLSLPEALVIAEAVTGIDSTVLANAARLGLLDSALYAPEAGFADFDLNLAVRDQDWRALNRQTLSLYLLTGSLDEATGPFHGVSCSAR